MNGYESLVEGRSVRQVVLEDSSSPQALAEDNRNMIKRMDIRRESSG
jgi:hypothetical protein